MFAQHSWYFRNALVRANYKSAVFGIDYSPVYVKRLVMAIGTKQMSVKEMMSEVGLKDRKNFIEYSLNPAISEGYVRLLYPQSPRHPRQKYLLTEKGLEVLKQ